MSSNATYTECLDVGADLFFKAISRYEDYPAFVSGVKQVDVKSRNNGKVLARYDVSIMKDVYYVLEHVEDEKNGSLTWTLIESDIFKKNSGSWTIKKLGEGRCEVTYAIEVEFKIPVPGFIVNKLVKGNLPSTVKSFAQKARAIQRG